MSRTDTSTEGAKQTARKLAFEYEPNNARFSKITIEPDAADETALTNGLKLATQFRYDSVGNLEEIESSNGSDRRLTTFVPCADYFAVRNEALRAHASQVDPDGPWFSVPLEIQQAGWPTEDYQLVSSAVPVELPEQDLFAGLRGPVDLAEGYSI